jgi:hypothetical protein
VNNEDIINKVKENLYLWLIDIHAGDRPEYAIGDMWIYKIIYECFPDLEREKEKIKNKPPMRATYFGDS